MRRPTIDPAERRNVPVNAFVTAKERPLEATAKAAVRTLSDWVRVVGMDAAK